MAEREILFRGKRNDNGEWVEGSFCGLDLDSGSYSYIIENSRRMNKSTVFDDFQHNSVLVIPETVGQFTGSTDKNGKKIFEGDIVSLTKWKGLIYKVVYDNCRYELYNANETSCYVLSIYKSKDIEVIGNIHDNPEILKGGGNDG